MGKRILLVALLLGLQGMTLAVHAEGHKQASAVAEPAAGTAWTEPKTGMAFVWVPTGCFQMGGYVQNSEQPIRKVCVKGFWMGKYEVTQAQYKQVLGVNPSIDPDLKNPVENVSWDDAGNFSEKMGSSAGVKIRLPTEAEWEYACRAGHFNEKFCGAGTNENLLAWHKGNSNRKIHPVGLLAANDWGLHDMSGSLWEWVQDCWHENYQGAPVDGSAWTSASCGKRVLRGGSWCNDPTYLTAAYRYGNFPDGGECGGFRVVRTPQ